MASLKEAGKSSKWIDNCLSSKLRVIVTMGLNSSGLQQWLKAKINLFAFVLVIDRLQIDLRIWWSNVQDPRANESGGGRAFVVFPATVL
jgi:hypothetical protein